MLSVNHGNNNPSWTADQRNDSIYEVYWYVSLINSRHEDITDHQNFLSVSWWSKPQSLLYFPSVEHPYAYKWTTIDCCRTMHRTFNLLLLPDDCPQHSSPSTNLVMPSTHANHADVQTPSDKKKKRKLLLDSSQPLVETEVRRSLRLEKQTNGFKRSSCSDKNCVACEVVPPSLSPPFIENLGQFFVKWVKNRWQIKS